LQQQRGLDAALVAGVQHERDAGSHKPVGGRIKLADRCIRVGNLLDADTDFHRFSPIIDELQSSGLLCTKKAGALPAAAGPGPGCLSAAGPAASRCWQLLERRDRHLAGAVYLLEGVLSTFLANKMLRRVIQRALYRSENQDRRRACACLALSPAPQAK